MRFTFLGRTCATVLALGLATPAMALPPLGEVTEIREGLIVAGLALELEDVCSDVSVRRLRGLNYLQGLRNRAGELGYTTAQIDAYVNDEAEQDRLEAEARSRLRSMGAVSGDAASHCAVAQAEIASGSVLGRLLR